MRKSILVTGPCLTQSGYGYQTRFALKALKSREDLFDVYIQPITWGQTGWIWEDNEFRNWMDERIAITQVLLQQKQLRPDMSLQVTIPNEWKKLAPVNIGYTAGIETNKVAPVWLAKGNEMDRIIVVSDHAKNVFKSTVATATNQETGEEFPYRLDVPITTVNYSVENHTPEPIEKLNLDYDFNFLLLSQWGPRKNFENTIKWWVEEFIDNEVGLVVKTNTACNSIMDRNFTEKRMSSLLSKYKDRKCKVYLLHGDLSESQIHSLYVNNKVKAFINLAHGEGFGLPMFEAAAHGLPVIAPAWSGQMDYLYHKNTCMFQDVEYSLAPVQSFAVWDGVVEKESSWAYPDQGSYKMSLRKVYKKWDEAKTLAMELKDIIHEKFSEEQKYKEFCDAVYGEEPDAEAWFRELEESFVEQE